MISDCKLIVNYMIYEPMLEDGDRFFGSFTKKVC